MDLNSKSVEAALYHMSRCKMPGFLAPIEFKILEGDELIGIVAKVTSWPQYPGDPIVTLEKVSTPELCSEFNETAVSVSTETYTKKVFTTKFALGKKDIHDKSLYEIADMCNKHMKRCVIELCKGMLDELWEC